MNRYEILPTNSEPLDSSGIDPSLEVVVRSNQEKDEDVFKLFFDENMEVRLYE